ncbi:uncharacterized protein LOC142597811 [Dermatophagoides farinae]|uniref:uncharacterized protein LOC142597811 n=1 Tax=Dermatophagoides farinae TaxID=6954 RepID=UPI003F644893
MMMYRLLLMIFMATLMMAECCPLHDAITMMARSSSSTTSDHLRLNNETMAKIYQNVSGLLKEINGNGVAGGNGGGSADSILVHLNQTSTNTSTMALIVKNEASVNKNNNNDIYEQYRMYYVQLADEPMATNNGYYRLYWKLFIDTFRNQMNNVMTTVWSPVTAITKYWRPNGPKQQQNNDKHSFGVLNQFTLPIILHAIDLPESIEQRIIEIQDFELESKKSSNESSSNGVATAKVVNGGNNNESKVTIETNIVQQMAKKILMRAITAFKGHLWAQLPRIRPSMLRVTGNNNGIGVFITDKGVRINLIGEQKSNGDVEFFEKKTLIKSQIK